MAPTRAVWIVDANKLLPKLSATAAWPGDHDIKHLVFRARLRRDVRYQRRNGV